MKNIFKVGELVIVNGKRGTVFNVNIRYGDYDVKFEDGRIEYAVKESELSSAK